jgi:hypothetical protein
MLVLAGVFLFLFSLLYTEKNGIESLPLIKKNHSSIVTVLKEDAPSSKDIKEIKTVQKLYSDSEEVADLYEGSSSDKKNNHAVDSVSQNNENNLKSSAEDSSVSGSLADKSKAVLFEDSSGAVDYSTLSMPIDLNADYSGIKRIGSGEFSIDDSGYNFISDKKLYRFDFHRIRDIKAGANYLALMPSSDAAAKLFIFDKEYSDIKKAEEQFSLYRKG